MWKFACNLVEKFSGLTPMKAFLKYIFQRISNDFLDHQPNIDFRKGQLQLIDLPLSAKKINQTFLMSSPYVMHSGVIQKLRITLPNLVEIASKSIEVEVSGLQLVFYPNKHFLERFNQQMKQMKQNSKFYDLEDNVRQIQFKEDDSLDFFKQIIRQILTNIKVNINNVCIKVFMNTPSQNKNNPKPQFYSMLRIPSIVVERSKQQQSTQTEDVEKYVLKMHQITTHLLRQDLKFPQYQNVKASRADFPYVQPSANHPSTLMLIGNQSKDNDAQSVILFFTIKKQLKTRTKKFIIKGTIPNIQFMVQPFQIKVIEKFITQLHQFKMLYHYCMAELRSQDSQFYNKINDVSQNLPVRQSMRMSTDLHASMDIFSSIMMSFQQKSHKQSHARRQGYLQSIMQQSNKGMSQFKAGLGDFSKQIDMQTKAKIKQQLKIKYNNTIKTNIDVGFIKVYCLKYNNSNTLLDYERVWTIFDKTKPVSINQHIPCSYFMFNLKQINIQSDDKQVISLTVKKVTLMNVRLANNKSVEQYHQSEDIFHSLQSFPKSQVSSQHFKQLPADCKNRTKKLVRFQKSPHQHYCINYIFWIAIKDPQRFKRRDYKHINCPTSQSEKIQTDLFSFGISLKLIKPGSKQSKTYMSIERIGIIIDSQVAKDLINIFYPLFTYRNLIENINLKKEQLNSVLEPKFNLRKSMISNLAYSRYDLTTSPDFMQMQEPIKQKKQQKNRQVTQLSIKNISLNLTDLILGEQNDLIQNEKNKLTDSQSFTTECLCEYHLKCITIQINKLKVLMNYRTKVLFKNSHIWLRTLSHQKIYPKYMVIGTPDANKSNRIFLESIFDNSEIEEKILLNIPYIKINVQKNQCLEFIKMAQKFGKLFKSLNNYSEYLRKQFSRLDKTSYVCESKAKKSAKTVDKLIIVHLENFQASILDFQIHISNLMVVNQPKQTSIKLNYLTILHMHKHQSYLKSVRIDTKQKLKSDKQIDTSTVVVQINPSFSLKEKQIQQFAADTKDREFFNKLMNHVFSLSVTISQTQQKIQQNNKVTDLKSTGKFGFMKRNKQQLQIISQEENQQIISINLNQSLLIRPCQIKNFLILKQDIKQIQKIINQGGLLQMFNQAPKRKRKDSDWSPQRKIKINMKLKQIRLDIFPYEDLKQSSSILSSTRSYLSIEGISMQLESCQKCSDFGDHLQSNIVQLQVKRIEIYFLYFNDTDPLKNPLVISRQQLSNYGFKRISVINSISTSIVHQYCINTKQNYIELTIKVDSIDGQCSSYTSIYLQHHIDTVLRMVSYLQQQFLQQIKQKKKQIIEQIQSDDEVQLIEQQSIKKQQELKSSQQNQFKSRTVEFLNIFSPNLTKTFVLKLLDIKRLTFSLYSGDDFSFLQDNEKMIQEEMTCQINQKNQVISKQQLKSNSSILSSHSNPPKIDSPKRYRKKDVDKYKNIRLVCDGIQLQLCKLKPKLKHPNIKQHTQTNMNIRCVFKIRTMNCIMNRMDEDLFYLLKTTQRFSIVLEIDGTKIKAKHFLPEAIQIGYTNHLNFLWNEREQAKLQLTKTAYIIPFQQSQQIVINVNKQTIYQILAFVPKTKLIINLQMIGWKVLNNQQISTVELFFHSRLSKYLQEDNNKVIMKWITDTLTNNMGSILANTFLGLFSKAIWFFLNCIKKIIIFPGEVFRVLKK